MKAFIDTYGRTSNISDSAAMRQALLDSGWMIVGSAEEADVVIINTCAVTGHTASSMLKAAAEPDMLNGYEHVENAGAAHVPFRAYTRAIRIEPYLTADEPPLYSGTI